MESEIDQRHPVDPAEPVTGTPEPVRLVLLLTSAFFVSWGAGFQELSAFNLSRFFPFLAGFLAVYWLLLGRDRIRAFPLPYNLFFFFILLHTAVGYVFLFPEDLALVYPERLAGGGAGLLDTATRGGMVVRFVLFAITGYAVGSLVKNRRELHLLSLAYGLGFSVSLLMEGFVWEYITRGFVRVGAGFLNPNSLGIAALVCCFLNLAVFWGDRTGPRTRAAGLVFVLAGIYGMLISVSRNTLFAFACGGLAVTLFLPLLKKLRWLLGTACLLLLAAAFLPEAVFETLPGRLTLEEVQETRWSLRQDIWSDYLGELESYFFLGVGLDRSVEVVRESSARYSDRPLIPHQTYLHILVEFGFVGLALFLAALVVFFRRGVARAAADPPGMENVAMLGLLTAFSVFSLTGGLLGERPVWLAFGVIAFTQYRLGNCRASDPAGEIRRKPSSRRGSV